uniref:Uncharacterized protein n=1 Tax=Anguilla anguilla TaxID=7936 RepID=A0A0E9QKG3_ANGAN
MLFTIVKTDSILVILVPAGHKGCGGKGRKTVPGEISR